MHFFCYDRWSDTWHEPYPATWFSTYARKPALAYHTLRRGVQPGETANPLGDDPSAGQFYLTVMQPGQVGGTYVPFVFATAFTSRDYPPEFGMQWQRLNEMIGGWDYTYGGAGASLFEDADMSSMRSIAYVVSNEQSINFLHLISVPLVDGAVNVTLHDGNDFHVMEAGLCRIMRDKVGDADSRCSANPWGFQ